MKCPAENTLLACFEGRLDRAQRASIEAHVDQCPDCHGLFAELARAASALVPTPNGPQPDRSLATTDPDRELFAGDQIGRFIIRRRVGAGGMGVVYEAVDPLLHRKIALKLLHDTSRAEMHERLLREAKAMARLSHPNVVAIHDVGHVGDRIFIAMAFIEGTTMAGWVREKPRTWQHVLDAYLRAGRGLAAAHDAGLIHRDFKPGNVLVGDDGRICVTDFGLARFDAADPEPAPLMTGTEPDIGLLELTRTGALMGSPGYMAPEQMEGAGPNVTPAADVFSFCVSLFEGLTGQLPFEGATLFARRTAIAAGKVRPLPEGCEVPAWLYTWMLRGLAADPSARPGLRDLLAELQRQRTFQGVSRAEKLLAEAQALASGGEQGVEARPFAHVAMSLLQDIVHEGTDGLTPAYGVAARSGLLDKVEMAGSHVAFILREMGEFATLASHYLAREGLGHLLADGTVQVDEAAWYPVPPFVRATHRLAADLGPRAAYNLGAATARFLPRVDELEVDHALSLIDPVYQQRFRAGGKPVEGEMLDAVGRFTPERRGEREVHLIIKGPWPCDFDRGFVAGAAQRLREDAISTHDPVECRKRGHPHCRHIIRWGAPPPMTAGPVVARLQLRPAKDLDDFLFDPIGRYVGSKHLLYAVGDGQLHFTVFWDVPDVQDVQLIAKAWEVLARPELLQHSSIVDMRRVTEARPEVYQAMADAVRKTREKFGKAVRAQAVLRPAGIAGAVVAGFYDVERPPFPARMFTDAREALGWLGRSDFTLLDEVDAIVGVLSARS